MMRKNSKKKTFDLQTVPREFLPRHIAIIMDGNGRWAEKSLLPRTYGHRAGMKTLKEIVKACSQLGIEVLTVYAFSTENWSRPQEEVDFLMSLMVEFIEKELDELHENNVKVIFIGDRNRVPEPCIQAIDRARIKTGNNCGMVFNVALNYGGRMEIARATAQIAEDVCEGRLKISEIDENLIGSYLFTAGLPDPDLLIRTAGEMRISNYLLWQIAYAEFVVVPQSWPEFSREDLHEAIVEFLRRERRFGGLK